MEKSPDAFRTISEVAELLETPAHVLRFWESRFTQIRPVKRAGGRRYYRPTDVALLAGIRLLLHDQGMTIKGVQKILREQGVRHVCALGADMELVAEAEAEWGTDAAPMAEMTDDTDRVDDGPAQAADVIPWPGPRPRADAPGSPAEVADHPGAAVHDDGGPAESVAGPQPVGAEAAEATPDTDGGDVPEGEAPDVRDAPGAGDAGDPASTEGAVAGDADPDEPAPDMRLSPEAPDDGPSPSAADVSDPPPVEAEAVIAAVLAEAGDDAPVVVTPDDSAPTADADPPAADIAGAIAAMLQQPPETPAPDDKGTGDVVVEADDDTPAPEAEPVPMQPNLFGELPRAERPRPPAPSRAAPADEAPPPGPRPDVRRLVARLQALTPGAVAPERLAPLQARLRAVARSAARSDR